MKTRVHPGWMILAVFAGIGIGFFFAGGEPEPDIPVLLAPETGMAAPAEESLLYICPMNCVPPMERSGACPVCGMELVAVEASEHGHGEDRPRVAFREEALAAAGVQTAPVERRLVTAEVRLFGRTEYDPVEQYRVTAFAPGIIDRIYVKRAGQMVRAGDPLFDMHSSELFVVEQELFEVLKFFPDTMDFRPARGQIYKRQMVPPRRRFDIPRPGEAPEAEITAKRAALERLDQIKRKMMLLGLSEENIQRVMARGLPSGISTVITPTSGIVQEQFAFKGSYVNTGETVFTIANPRYVWARLEGYAADFPWIRIGQDVSFEVDTYPGRTFTGKVQFLDPEFDPRTRIFDVGVLYNDPRKLLRPNMLVRAVIHSTMTASGVVLPGREQNEAPPLVIPDSAPLITGNRAVVYVEVAGQPGTYEGREIVLGPRGRDYVIVEAGLEEGESVVINGNFKIDSAVQILAKTSMMEIRGGLSPGEGHRHGAAPAVPVVPLPEMTAVDRHDADDGMQGMAEAREEHREEHAEVLPGTGATAGPESYREKMEAMRSAVRAARNRPMAPPGTFGATDPPGPEVEKGAADTP